MRSGGCGPRVAIVGRLLAAAVTVGGADALRALQPAPAAVATFALTRDATGAEHGRVGVTIDQPGAGEDWLLAPLDDLATQEREDGQPGTRRRAACGDPSAVEREALVAYQRELRRLRAEVDGTVRPQLDSVLRRLSMTVELSRREKGAGAARDAQLRALQPDVERLAWTMMEHSARTPEARVGVRRPLGWVGVNTAESSLMRWTGDGRVVSYCAYPVVVSVEPASPAERAGLAAGDTLVAYDGRDLVKSAEVALDRVLVPGRTVRVTVRRGGKKVVRPLVVGERSAIAWRQLPPGTVAGVAPRAPRPPRAPLPPGEAPLTRFVPAAPIASLDPMGSLPPAPDAPDSPTLPRPPAAFAFAYSTGVSGFAGAQLVAVDADLREALGTADGVLVLKVLPGTAAADAGLRAGDVIRRVDGREVRSPAAVQRLGGRSPARALKLDVERRGKRKDVVLRW